MAPTPGSLLLFVFSLLLAGRQSDQHLIKIDFSAKSFRLPESFMGFSHEPLSDARHMVTVPAYREIIRLLQRYDTGPLVLRWGGNSQDLQTEPHPISIWKSLANFHNATGVRYILGLNLKTANESLALQQASAAMREVPAKAVLSWAVGNEPDSYTYRFPQKFPHDYIHKGWFQDQAAYAEVLAPVLMHAFGTTKVMSGPGLADMGVWGGSAIRKWATGPGTARFANMVTGHFYANKSTKPGVNISSYLQESSMEFVYKTARRLFDEAKRHGLHFRVEETNTLSVGGLLGASDRFGAALYALDYALTLAKAGIDGMNFQNPTGCTAYGAVAFPTRCLDVTEHGHRPCITWCWNDTKAALQVRPLLYGIWMFQQAVEGRPEVMQQGVSATIPSSGPPIKAHALKNATHSKVVLVNKDLHGRDANVSVQFLGTYGPGHFIRLRATSLLTRTNITLAGQKIDSATGRPAGTRRVHDLQPTYALGSTFYQVHVPAASALLLWAEPQGGGAPPGGGGSSSGGGGGSSTGRGLASLPSGGRTRRRRLQQAVWWWWQRVSEGS